VPVHFHFLASNDRLVSQLQITIKSALYLAEAATRGYKFDILAKPTHPTAMLDTALDMLVANQSKQPLEAATSG